MYRKGYQLLVSLALLGSVAGCVTVAAPIEMPVPPQPVRLTMDLPVEVKSPKLDVSKYVQTGLENAPQSASKVVININTDIREKIFCFERTGTEQCNAGRKGGSASGGKEGEEDNKIETTAFVSDTERQMEKELIKKGFRVINRARLEAKLREMRDSRDDCKGSWSNISPDCLNQLPREAQDLLSFYNAEHKAGRLVDVEFIKKTGELRDKYQYSSAGKRREANEMTDVSEVIRAAKDGEVGADYIMLVNGFNFGPQKRVVNLLSYETVAEFARKDAKIEPLVKGKQYVGCFQGAVSLDASLIHVKSGEVVWIGEHVATEDMLTFNDSGLTFSLVFEDRVVNVPEVTSFVERNNTEEARKFRGANGIEVSIPPWQWASTLDVNVLNGMCSTNSDVIKSRGNLQVLTEVVARELIATIRTQSAPAFQTVQ